MVAKRWRQPERLAALRVASCTRYIPSLGLQAKLSIPVNASVLIAFAHGSGSSHLSPRNRSMARILNTHGMATLLFDLLTPEEGADQENVFDIMLLSERLAAVLHWVQDEEELVGLPVGLFSTGTAAAAALMVTARPNAGIFAVVSRGGRPDLAGESLNRIAVPVLLAVGGRDPAVLKLNENALACLKGPRRLKVIADGGQSLEEAGALEDVAASAARWFKDYSPVKPPGSI